MDYIIRSCDFPKKEYFPDFDFDKISKNGNFDGLYKQVM